MAPINVLAELMPKTVFGVPAHPLLVHVPVILVPLATGALATTWVVRTGHTGAESVWHGRAQRRYGGGGDRGGPTRGGVDGD